LTVAELALTRADSYKGLYGIIGDLGDFRVDAKVADLDVSLYAHAIPSTAEQLGCNSARVPSASARTYMVKHEEVRSKASGKIVVDTGLFAA
jgi:hypothetical protein